MIDHRGDNNYKMIFLWSTYWLFTVQNVPTIWQSIRFPTFITSKFWVNSTNYKYSFKLLNILCVQILNDHKLTKNWFLVLKNVQNKSMKTGALSESEWLTYNVPSVIHVKFTLWIQHDDVRERCSSFTL